MKITQNRIYLFCEIVILTDKIHIFSHFSANRIFLSRHSDT